MPQRLPGTWSANQWRDDVWPQLSCSKTSGPHSLKRYRDGFGGTALSALEAQFDYDEAHGARSRNHLHRKGQGQDQIHRVHGTNSSGSKSDLATLSDRSERVG